MHRREFLAALALTTTTAGLLGACGRGPDAATAPVPPPVGDDELRRVRLRVGDQKGNSQSLLRSAGLDRAPYAIEWATFTSGPPLLEAASAGAIDIGGVGNTPPLFAAAAKREVKVVSASKGNVTSDALIVPRDSPLRRVEDLRGKKIALARGSSAHGQVLLSLRKVGLTPDDVQLVILQPADALGAFNGGEVDAWAIWDPYFAQVQLETGAKVLTDGTGISNGLDFQVASDEALADAAKNTALADYVVRVAQAQLFSDSHRAERARAWAEDTGLPIEVTRRATDAGPNLPIPLDDAVVRSSQELADAFVQAGEIPRSFDFAEYVDTRFAQRLAAVR
ncbi:ABC transporter substrate-binding protein [Saccharopolyspora sp. NPDC047091]|uniref:ABC transporter substrate-binding protein n=1 Tax=Saccharopolyspora sp. NPDC047091 TaxID=3155924 RepID=UPI0033EEE723